MSNENLPENSNDRKENMSQLTGKPESVVKSSSPQDRKVATHSLADVAAARSAQVGKPVLVQLVLPQKEFMPGLAKNMFLKISQWIFSLAQ